MEVALTLFVVFLAAELERAHLRDTQWDPARWNRHRKTSQACGSRGT